MRSSRTVSGEPHHVVLADRNPSLEGPPHLHVTFDDGASHALAAELLRVESPSAEVQGHGPTQKKTIPGKREVEILKVEPVGHYAVKLTFDDMHDTGIFGWGLSARARRDGRGEVQAYLDALEAQGLSREPLRRR